jgi:large subunit ribosomal protein L15
MPLHRRLPKRGFNNIFAKKFNELNLGKIQGAIDAGTLDGKKPITVEALKEAGLIRRTKDGVRLLGSGEIKGKLAFEVTGASASAIKAVEAKGGTVTLKSITGREKPAADFIKAEKRAKKREALAAKAQAKSGKKAKGEEQEGAAEAEAPKAKKAKPEGKAEQGEARPEKAKPAKKDKSE